MPDGDVIHENLRPRYYGVYKQICEGQFSPEELSRDALRPLKKDIADLGASALDLIGHASRVLEPFGNGGTVTPAEWLSAIEEMEAAARNTMSSKRTKNLVLRAFRAQLLAVKNGNAPQPLYTSTIEALLRGLYVAEFEERIPLTSAHHMEANASVVQDRLAEMRPFVEQGLSKFAEQLARGGVGTRLRLPGRHSATVDLETDVLSIGRA